VSEQGERDQQPTARVWPPPPLPGSDVGTTQPLDQPLDEPLDEPLEEDAEAVSVAPPVAPAVPAAPTAPTAPTPVAAAAPPEAPAQVPPARPRSGHGVRMPTVVFGLLLCLVAGSVQAARFGDQRLDIGTLVVAALLVSGVLLVAGAILGAPGRHRR
jgi:hypothetical protein